MTAQTRRQTAGKRAVKLLIKSPAAGCQWDEREQLTLAMIERAEDRATALRELFDAEVAKPKPSTRRVTGERRAAPTRGDDCEACRRAARPDARRLR
jgi:hypothetical protein